MVCNSFKQKLTCLWSCKFLNKNGTVLSRGRYFFQQYCCNICHKLLAWQICAERKSVLYPSVHQQSFLVVQPAILQLILVLHIDPTMIAINTEIHTHYSLTWINFLVEACSPTSQFVLQYNFLCMCVLCNHMGVYSQIIHSPPEDTA